MSQPEYGDGFLVPLPGFQEVTSVYLACEKAPLLSYESYFLIYKYLNTSTKALIYEAFI